MNTTDWKTKACYEEVYREGYDTASNYHIYGVYSGHTVVKNEVQDENYRIWNYKTRYN